MDKHILKGRTPDERFMLEALRQAKKAYALGETPIGCVIVRTRDYEGNELEPRIVARGYNRRNTEKSPLAHAEITAVRKAAKALGDWRLEGCTLYVTLEPCQMCAGAIVQARIDRVVIGAMNPKAGCAGSILNLLQEPRFNHQAEITQGVLQPQCSRMMSGFFAELRQKKTAESGSF
ncbi:MAG: tRNA adenosine(34) deaminase TadA [Lachnospiraceae bacterium]|nr:tRNA adenosine(34) deaminase TadA [Lachnospiraceae bacterium]